MSIKSAFTDFRKGLSFLFGKPEEGEGDRKLAKMSQIVMAQIPNYGKRAVRTQVIKSIESDFKKWSKKGGKDLVEEKIQNALRTPEYMQLLRKLDLNEIHLRIMAKEALKKNEKRRNNGK